MAGEAGVGDVDFGRFDEALAEILEVGSGEEDLAGDFEDVQPLAHGGDGDAERGGEIGAVEELAVAAGDEREEAAERAEVAVGAAGVDRGRVGREREQPEGEVLFADEDGTETVGERDGRLGAAVGGDFGNRADGLTCFGCG